LKPLSINLVSDLKKMNQQKDDIINFAQQLFLETGFSNVKVDDIAAGMKISKKTIYKHFKSKEELLELAFHRFLYDSRDFIFATLQEDSSSVVKLVLILNRMIRQTARISNAFLADLQNDMPELWKKFEHFRNNMISNVLTEIYSAGIKEGYVKHFKVPILLSVFIGGLKEILNSEFLNSQGLTFKESLAEFYKFITSSILTDKGREEFSNLYFGALYDEKI